MISVDRLETAGRMVLWLSMASAVILVPVTYIRQRATDAQQAEAARNEERAKAKDAEKSNRLWVETMGHFFTVLDATNAVGRVWFSNVSARSGIVCIAGSAVNPNTKASTESLTSCKHVAPYASDVEIEVMFAGGDLAALCKGVTCKFVPRDMPDATPPSGPGPTATSAL